MSFIDDKHRFGDLEEENLQALGLYYFGYRNFQKATSGLDLHDHGNCVEIVFLLRGTQNYYIEEKEHILIGGQAFIAFPNQPHKSGRLCQDVAEFYWFQLDLSCTDNLLGFNKEMSQSTIQQLLSIKEHVISFDTAFFKKLLHSSYQEFHQNGASPLALSSLMHLLHLFLNNTQKNNTQKKLSRQDNFQKLEQYIEDHLLEEITMEQLCRETNMSLSTLQHTFKTYFARSPAEYINFRKIQRSKDWLLAGKTVTETAMLMRFNTSDYFSTVFRKFNGMSPSLWLKKTRSMNN